MADFGSEQGRPPEGEMTNLRAQQRSFIFSRMPEHAENLIKGERLKYSAGVIPNDRPHLYADYDQKTGDYIQADIYKNDLSKAYKALGGEDTPDLHYRNPYPDLLGLAATASSPAELANSFGFLAFGPQYAHNDLSSANVTFHQSDFLDTTHGNPQPSEKAAELVHAIAQRVKEVRSKREPGNTRTPFIEIYQEFFDPHSPNFQKYAPYLAEAYLALVLDPHSERTLREHALKFSQVLRFGRNGSEAPLQIFAQNASYWKHVDASWVEADFEAKRTTYKGRKERNDKDSYGSHSNFGFGAGFGGGPNFHDYQNPGGGYDGYSSNNQSSHRHKRPGGGYNGHSSEQGSGQSQRQSEGQETSEQLAARWFGIPPDMIPNLPEDQRKALGKFAQKLAMASHPDLTEQLPPQVKARAEVLAHSATYMINKLSGKKT